MASITTGEIAPLIMSYNSANYFSYSSIPVEIIKSTDTETNYLYRKTNGDEIFLFTNGYNHLSGNGLYTSITIGDSSGRLISFSDILVGVEGFFDVFQNAFANPNILNGDDSIGGTRWDDELIGFTGGDWINGFAGNDIIRAGNGPDLITGGSGSDIMYGGFGKNSFFENADGYEDTLYVKSDQFAYNYLYGKAGNSPNGEKIDRIFDADPFDKIIVQGVETSRLSVGYYFDDVAIFADGYVEAVFVDSSLTNSQVAMMTSGQA